MEICTWSIRDDAIGWIKGNKNLGGPNDMPKARDSERQEPERLIGPNTRRLAEERTAPSANLMSGCDARMCVEKRP